MQKSNSIHSTSESGSGGFMLRPVQAIKQALMLPLAVAAVTATLVQAVNAEELGWPEKEELKFDFIKLTDMAPIAIAYENGYFEDEGLYVMIEAQANWKVLLNGVIDGTLDGAHMLAGQPIAATIGFGTKAHIITPFSMDLNGNGITVSNDIWEQMKPNIPKMDYGRPVHPISIQTTVHLDIDQCHRSESGLLLNWRI